MGLGGTAKKIQKLSDAAEQLYSKMNEVIGQLKELRTQVETTSQQVDGLERDVAEQRALLEALAEKDGLDVEEILAEADLPPETEANGETEGSDGATDDADYADDVQARE